MNIIIVNKNYQTKEEKECQMKLGNRYNIKTTNEIGRLPLVARLGRDQ